MCPILFVYTDGGPDHRTTFWSVKLAHIATFIALDLDMLIAARTAPSRSFCNPARSRTVAVRPPYKKNINTIFEYLF